MPNPWMKRILDHLYDGRVPIDQVLVSLGDGARGPHSMFVYGDLYGSIDGLSRPLGNALAALVRCGLVRIVQQRQIWIERT